MTTIEREIKALKERMTQLEYHISQQERSRTPVSFSPGAAVHREQLRFWLEAEGVVAKLPPAAQKQAGRWRKMTGDEKQEHVQSMHDLKLDPPLSQIIVENRK